MSTEEKKKKSTEEYMVEFLKYFRAIEDAMEPFKDQRKDLRENFHENGWLSKEEMRLAVKAYRFMKQDTDIDQLKSVISKLKLRGFRHA